MVRLIDLNKNDFSNGVYKVRAKYYEQVGDKIIARQQLEPVYHRNGITYVITRECLINIKPIKGEKMGALINKDNHISVDTELDLFDVKFRKDIENISNPYGDGKSSKRIIELLKTVNLDGIVQKRFYE